MGGCASKEAPPKSTKSPASPVPPAEPVKAKEPEASPSGASVAVPSVGDSEPPELTDAEREEKLRKIFRQVDKDDSGFIDFNELKVLRDRMKLGVDDECTRFILSRYDDDKSGKLNFEEFCEMTIAILEVRKQYEVADKDKNGSISQNELQALLAAKNFTPELANEILALFDENGNGSIEHNEFFALYFYVNELEYQYKVFPERRGQDFSWLLPLLGSENSGKADEVGKQLLEMRKIKPYPPVNEFAKIIVKAAAGATSPMGRPKKAPRILSQRARVRPPPRKVLKVEPSTFIQFKHTGGPFHDLSFKPSFDILPPKAQGVVKEWKRMKEINIDAKLFINGADEGDVIQGGLGDCWFLGALAVVATSAENFIEHLFVQQLPEIGYYQCRFFKNGKWELVEVDDKLPVNEKGDLVFASCKDPREFWVPIIEKAYAKLHGSYSAIESGSIADALKDLTGEGIEVTHLDSKTFQKNHELAWQHLLHNIKESFLMGCAIDEPELKNERQLECGLLSGHAYSIISCVEVDGNKLIRMRNPWGHGEWNGAWADFSKEWKPEYLAQLNYQFANDGTFFMAFSDFIKYYSRVYVLRLLTDSTGEMWNKFSMNGGWHGEAAAGCANHHNWLNNPQYVLTVTNPNTKIFINLSQPDLRYMLKASLAAIDKDYEAIGLYILSTKDEKFRKVVSPQEERIATSAFTNVRDLSFEFTLGTGSYVVIPCTFNPGVQLTYDFTLYSNKPVEFCPLTAVMPTLTVQGEWKGATAGGCGNNHDTWLNNPQFLLVCGGTGNVELHLTQEDKPNGLEAVGIYVFGSPIRARVDQPELLLMKPSNIINLPTVTETLSVATNANYIIMPTTFEKGIERKFSLSVSSATTSFVEFRSLLL